jgi:hypothetical protein
MDFSCEDGRALSREAIPLATQKPGNPVPANQPRIVPTLFD